MTEEISAADFNAMMEKRKVGKYGNRRIDIDGVSWDSEAEYNRWWHLQQLERDGAIANLRRQVRIPLTVDEVKLGVYVADFMYLLDGRESPLSRTPIYEWKKRHVVAQYGIEITEIES